MQQDTNELGQPIGFPLPNWSSPKRPQREVVTGRFCRLEPLSTDVHAADLHVANVLDVNGAMWTYLPYGPFESLESYCTWTTEMSLASDPLLFAIVDVATNKAAGVAAYLRIDPKNGSIEVGHLNFSPLLKRTPAATEAMFLMMEWAFTLGYRRYEWKCNALNAPSRASAERLGFTFEGIFRQATIVKGRSRDTAWFSVIDSEWPALRERFHSWLAPENFDENGRQRTRLQEIEVHC
ncbi:MAG TPA: GNAT family protein [Chthoniobacterales bacterium]